MEFTAHKVEAHVDRIWHRGVNHMCPRAVVDFDLGRVQIDNRECGSIGMDTKRELHTRIDSPLYGNASVAQQHSRDRVCNPPSAVEEDDSFLSWLQIDPHDRRGIQPSPLPAAEGQL